MTQTDTQGEKATWRWRQRLEWRFYKPKRANDSQQTTRSWVLPHSPQKEPTLWTPWSQTSRLQIWETVNAAVEAMQFVVLYDSSPSKLICLECMKQHVLRSACDSARWVLGVWKGWGWNTAGPDPAKLETLSGEQGGGRGHVGRAWEHLKQKGGGMGWTLFSFNFFNWSIVDLQCCVNFHCTAKWFSYTYIYTYSFLKIFLKFIIYFIFGRVRSSLGYAGSSLRHAGPFVEARALRCGTRASL